MEKKELKFYEAPDLEVLDVNVEGFFCSSDTNAENVGSEDLSEELPGL